MGLSASGAPSTLDRPHGEPRRHELIEAGLSLLGLSALALAQPLLSLLSDNATFFVVRGSTAGDIVALAIVVALGPPLVLFLLELAVYAVSASARRVVHVTLLALLTAVLVLPILRDLISGPSGLLIPLALLVGAAAAALYARGRALRLMLNVLSPLPVIVVIIFLFFSPVSKLVVPEKASAGAVADSDSDTPVVMVVLDELDGDTLMQADRTIDAARFPNFAGLARRGDWFRNASSSADVTELAVPAILTGQEPKKGDLPIESDHPQNIFTLLGSSHDMNVTEQLTTLCPERLCGRRARPAFSDRMSSLASDLRLVWLHQLLPDDLANDLPPVDRSWGDFGDHGDEDGGGSKSTSPRGEEQRVATTVDRPGAFHDFLRNIRPAAGRPQLSLLHILIPHVPYEYLPSGREYPNGESLNGLIFDTWFDTTEALRAEQRYTLQLQEVDRLVGELIARLRAVGQYDRSLVVVTADHGVNFRTGERRRTVSEQNSAEITPVPLFVKLPGERHGRTIDRHVSTIDILPTLGDVLGLRIPWTDGRSALDPKTDRRDTVIYSHDPHFTRFAFDNTRLDQRRRSALAGRIARVGVGKHVTTNEPGDELVGRRVITSSLARPDRAVAVIDEAAEFPSVDLKSGILPAFVTGHLDIPKTNRKDVLALALNGRIAAVTRLFTKAEPPGFEMLVPVGLFRQGFNRVEIFKVTNLGASPSLTLLGASPRSAPQGVGRPRLERSGDSEVVRLGPGRSIVVTPGRFAGFVDSLTATKNKLEIRGWAADPKSGTPAERILAFSRGSLVAQGRPRLKRPDLKPQYGAAAAAGAGYRLVFKTILARQLAEPGALRIVAIRGGRASELKGP
jgi:sulfatase-like protein